MTESNVMHTRAAKLWICDVKRRNSREKPVQMFSQAIPPPAISNICLQLMTNMSLNADTGLIWCVIKQSGWKFKPPPPTFIEYSSKSYSAQEPITPTCKHFLKLLVVSGLNRCENGLIFSRYISIVSFVLLSLLCYYHQVTSWWFCSLQ